MAQQVKNHSFEYTDLGWQSDVSAFEYAVYICHSFSSKEQASFLFMAAVTVCSDFGAQENKVCHCFYCFPIYFTNNKATTYTTYINQYTARDTAGKGYGNLAANNGPTSEKPFTNTISNQSCNYSKNLCLDSLEHLLPLTVGRL